MSEFIKFLFNLLPHHRIYIQTHDFPDPDAVASAFGLKQIMHEYGINAELCYMGQIESTDVSYILEAYNLPFHEYKCLRNMQEYDKIILVDGQKFNSNMTDLPGLEIACIDHHALNRARCTEAAYEYVDIRPVGACASIITEYYCKLGIPILKEVATLLLYGIKIDTGYFQRGVTPLDIKAFSILDKIADHQMLKRLAARTLKLADLTAFGAAINEIKIYNHLGIVKIPFCCPDHLIAQVADFVLSLAEVDTAIIYSERDQGLKFSARTILPHVHCGDMLKKVLSKFGGNGGGHSQMAGGFIAQKYPDKNIEKEFIDYFSQAENKI